MVFISMLCDIEIARPTHIDLSLLGARCCFISVELGSWFDHVQDPFVQVHSEQVSCTRARGRFVFGRRCHAGGTTQGCTKVKANEVEVNVA